MKKRNFRTITALLLALMMLFSSVTFVSAEGTTETPETTTGSYDEGYDDGYNSGYNDGYTDGFGDGYNTGFGDGYYEGSGSGMGIFETIRERIYEIRYRIQSFFKNLRKKFREIFGLSDIDKNYLPSADTTNLGEDENAYYICEEFNEKAYALYYPEKPINYTKTAKVGIEIVDCTGGKLVAGIVNPIVENYLVDEVTEYTYQQYFASGMQSVYVNPYGLQSATKTVNDDGTTDYEFLLIDEATFFDGEDDYLLDSDGELGFGNFYNYDVSDVMIMSYLNFDPVKIKRATIYYPGTTVKATADAEGRLITLDILMPVEGSGKVNMGLNVELKGYRNESFDISYPDFDFDIDTDLIPDESQDTLEDDAEATAIIEEFQDIVNDTAAAIPDDATLTRTRELQVQITDCPGGKTVASILDPIIDNFTGETTDTETLKEGETSYLLDTISLYPAGLITAEKTQNADGTTDYSFVLASEKAVFDGVRTYGVKYVDGAIIESALQHHYICMGVIPEYLDLGPVTISSADIYYQGAIITAKVDAEGRLVSYNVTSTVEGTGTGKAGPIRATIGLAGNDTETIEIVYG